MSKMIASPSEFLSGLAYVMEISRRPDGSVDRDLVTKYDTKHTPNAADNSFDTIIDASRNVWIRLYRPTTVPNNTTLPVLIYYHGGGFAYMAADSKPYNDLCLRFARELPAVVISVNYRLSPEHRYPSHYEDGFDALKFIDTDTNNIKGFPASADIKRCYTCGDSAGANLAHHVTLKAVQHDFRKLKVAGIVALQPFFGGEERTKSELNVKCPLITLDNTDWFWKSFLPKGENRDHHVVNVFGPNAFNISTVKFPATLIFVGGLDPLNERGKMYHQGLKKSGTETYLIEYPNAIHTFYAMPDGIDAASMIKEMRDFMHKSKQQVAISLC